MEIKNEIEKNKIFYEINKIVYLDSKYSIKIYDYFIKKEKEKEFVYIFIDYFKNGNLENLIQSKNYLNSLINWRIFIQIVLGMKAFHDDGLILEKLCPKNIFIDDEQNIKIGGYGLTLDFTNESYQSLLAFYYSPEVLNGESFTKESDMWSLGCVLYELLFKKKAFNSLECIFQYYYEINEQIEDDFKYILSKLLCYDKKRLLINRLLIDTKFKKKLIETNLFDEITKTTLKGK